MARRVNIILRDAPISTAPPVDTGRAFLITIPQKGTFDPTKPVRSLGDLQTRYGSLQSYSHCWNWCEEFFREGGYELYLIPVRGPAAAAATLNIPGTSGTILVATANSVGDWANGATGGYAVQVIAGPVNGAGYRQLVVFYGGIEVGRSAEFNDPTVINGVVIDNLTLTLGGGSGLPPVAAAANLASGTLDRGNITITQITAAIQLPTRDLGPGQMAAPDWQTTPVHQALAAQCAATNRWALPDGPNTGVKATLKTLDLATAAAVQADGNGDYTNQVLHPWTRMAGISGGAERQVPASAFVAAKCAQTDRSAGPAQAPAGAYGRATSTVTLGVTQTFSDADQLELEAAGGAMVIVQNGVAMFDTNRSLVSPTGPEKQWLQAGVCRYRMAFVARAESALGGFPHRKLTPTTIAAAETAIRGILMRDEQNDWLLRLPGEPVGASYAVQTDDPVNTPATIAAQQLNVAAAFRPAPGADLVNLTLTAVAATDTVSG
jgi:hypothetical protein